MSVSISLTLEASEMFLSFHMIFSLERAAVVRAILERISGFDPLLEMIAPRYLKFSTSSLWPFILISLWKPFGLFVITFVLSGLISILYLVVVLSRRSIKTPVSSSSSAFTTMSSAKRKLQRILRLNICSVVLLPALKPGCSSAMISSACGWSLFRIGERGGSVVECRTAEREVRGSRPTAAVLCPWARHFTPRKYWLITQEAMAPSRHDWKIVDWDVKPQHNQPTV